MDGYSFARQWNSQLLDTCKNCSCVQPEHVGISYRNTASSPSWNVTGEGGNNVIPEIESSLSHVPNLAGAMQIYGLLIQPKQTGLSSFHARQTACLQPQIRTSNLKYQASAWLDKAWSLPQSTFSTWAQRLFVFHSFQELSPRTYLVSFGRLFFSLTFK